MKAVCNTLAGILIVAVFVTTLCAQACVDPSPAATDCPAHHTKDCCKHDDSSSARVTADTLNVYSLHKSPVHWPAQTPLTFETALQSPQLAFDRIATFHASAPIIGPPTIPLALRI